MDASRSGTGRFDSASWRAFSVGEKLMATRIVPGIPLLRSLLNYITEQIAIAQGDIDGGSASSSFEDTIDGGDA